MNITGNAKSWLNAENENKETIEINVERKSIIVTKEIKALKDVCDKLDKKQKETPNKHLNDAVVDLLAAIMALEKIKN